MPDEFDPLDYENLTRHVVEALMQRPMVALAGMEEFEGAGVYALFYTGDLPFYSRVRSLNGTAPIYAGKAVPKGARKGQARGGRRALYNRLRDHRKSIDAARNLSATDFQARWLAVKPLWITMAEQFLIRHHSPIWNSCIDGFGNHDPGGKRVGKRSRWDTLHPGRVEGWSTTVEDVHEPAHVLAELKSFLDRVGGGS